MTQDNQNQVNLIKEMRRVKMREEWAAENQVALAERCKVMKSEGGTAAERLYGVIPPLES